MQYYTQEIKKSKRMRKPTENTRIICSISASLDILDSVSSVESIILFADIIS